MVKTKETDTVPVPVPALDEVLAVLASGPARKQLRAKLEQERDATEARLEELNTALAGLALTNGAGPGPRPGSKSKPTTPTARQRAFYGRRKMRAHIPTKCRYPRCPRHGVLFKARKRNALYCSQPCSDAHRRMRKERAEQAESWTGVRVRSKGKGKGRDKRHLLANLAKARAALAAKRAAEKLEAKRAAKRGKVLVPGDPLQAGESGEKV